MNALIKIQKELKAPKGQTNTFGKYKYRSCEDILEAVKPLLDGSMLTLSDEVVLIGERYYVKAIVTLFDGKERVVVEAFAREALVKKGMDESQITGAASSYARKYALNGMFCIDDTKDADTMDNKTQKPASKKKDPGELDYKAMLKKLPIMTEEEAKMIGAIYDLIKGDRGDEYKWEVGVKAYNILGRRWPSSQDDQEKVIDNISPAEAK